MRDYLELEFRPKPSEPALPFDFDLERVIDDFVLFCMLIGNDFLPCAPRGSPADLARHRCSACSLRMLTRPHHWFAAA